MAWSEFYEDTATYRAGRTARALGFGLMPFGLIMLWAPIYAIAWRRRPPATFENYIDLSGAIVIFSAMVMLPVAAGIAARQRVLGLSLMVAASGLLALLALATLVAGLPAFFAVGAAPGLVMQLLLVALIALAPTLLIIQAVRALISDELREPADPLDEARDRLIGWAVGRGAIATIILTGAATLAWASVTDRPAPPTNYAPAKITPWDGDARPADALDREERSFLLRDVRDRGAPELLVEAYDEALRAEAWSNFSAASYPLLTDKRRPIHVRRLEPIAKGTTVESVPWGDVRRVTITLPWMDGGALSHTDASPVKHGIPDDFARVVRGDIDYLVDGQMVTRRLDFQEVVAVAPTFARIESRLLPRMKSAGVRLTSGQAAEIIQRARAGVASDRRKVFDRAVGDAPDFGPIATFADGTISISINGKPTILRPDGVEVSMPPAEELAARHASGESRYARTATWPALSAALVASVGLVAGVVLLFQIVRVRDGRRRWMKINLAIGVFMYLAIAWAVFDYSSRDLIAHQWLRDWSARALVGTCLVLAMLELGVLASTLHTPAPVKPTEIIGQRAPRRLPTAPAKTRETGT